VACARLRPHAPLTERRRPWGSGWERAQLDQLNRLKGLEEIQPRLPTISLRCKATAPSRARRDSRGSRGHRAREEIGSSHHAAARTLARGGTGRWSDAVAEESFHLADLTRLA
jgi:hypothetical protein